MLGLNSRIAVKMALINALASARRDSQIGWALSLSGLALAVACAVVRPMVEGDTLAWSPPPTPQELASVRASSISELALWRQQRAAAIQDPAVVAERRLWISNQFQQRYGRTPFTVAEGASR